MKILLIDTCGTTGSLALADTTDSPTRIDCATLPGRSAAERIVPTIRSLADECCISLGELDAVAVVHGPGSFTGVRVGLSAAKGLCHAHNLPVVAISRLAVLASMFPKQTGYVRAILDAGRGEFYCGLYIGRNCQQESLLTRDQLFATVSHNTLDPADQNMEAHSIFVVCERAIAQSLDTLSPQIVAEPTAADALPLAIARIQQQSFDNSSTIDANYLRRSDAEIFAKPIAAAVPQPSTAGFVNPIQ